VFGVGLKASSLSEKIRGHDKLGDAGWVGEGRRELHRRNVPKEICLN